MPNEHPILMSAPMVQATMQGRKTMTRRIVKMKEVREAKFGYTSFTPAGHISVRGVHANGEYGESFIKCPYGKPGDLLWVREGFYCDMVKDRNGVFNEVYRYKADFPIEMQKPLKWKPSIHMPKAAARIWLQITDVRVERVQHISSQDAVNEGVLSRLPENGIAQSQFKDLWFTINGADSWQANPWVWVITYKVLSITGKLNDAELKKDYHPREYGVFLG